MIKGQLRVARQESVRRWTRNVLKEQANLEDGVLSEVGGGGSL